MIAASSLTGEMVLHEQRLEQVGTVICRACNDRGALSLFKKL
jgi:hypothetical protein